MGSCLNKDLSKEQMVDYNNIKKEMKPLDLIFFRGDDVVSETIRTLELLRLGDGKWSHVGLVINKKFLPTLKVTDEDELFVWESTFSSPLIKMGNTVIPDVESKHGVFGVQIRSLKELLKYSNEKSPVSWAKLENNPLDIKEENKEDDLKRIEEIKLKLSNLHTKYYHKTYQYNVSALCLGLAGCNCFKDDRVFCSEFVALVYQELGLISKEVNASNIVPVDLSNAKNSDESILYKSYKQLVKEPVNLKIENRI